MIAALTQQENTMAMTSEITARELTFDELNAVSGGNCFANFNNAAVAATNPGLTLAIGAVIVGGAAMGIGLAYMITTPHSQM
jgi:uncharacterized membrane protein YedE/YeeE